MKQKKKNQIAYWLKIAVLGIILGFGLQFVRAWTEPTSSPPNGNVGAPINTGSQGQTKTGGFRSNTSLSAPNIYADNGIIIGGWGYVCECYSFYNSMFGELSWSNISIDTYKQCPGWGYNVRIGTIALSSPWVGFPTGNGGSGNYLCQP
jgi:hypothetical protein